MRLNKKSLSRVTLNDLLRRKKTTLENFLQETGIVTYELLKARCSSIGVVPPSEEEFMSVKGNPATHEVSSPMEGIIVMNPPRLEDLLPDLVESVADEAEVTTEVPIESSLEESSKTKKKKKKEVSGQT